MLNDVWKSTYCLYAHSFKNTLLSYKSMEAGTQRQLQHLHYQKKTEKRLEDFAIRDHGLRTHCSKFLSSLGDA